MSEVKRLMRFSDDAVTVARRLLGRRLVRVVDGERLAGTIVEVEAYLGAEDAAAHTFNGRRTSRNESMYLEGGHAYVYLIYGVHHCLNVVCGRAGAGTAVLIRAIEPTEGVERMAEHRAATVRERSLTIASGKLGPAHLRTLCSGPGKLTQALRIDRCFDGRDLRTDTELFIETPVRRLMRTTEIASGPRVGVDYAGPWAHQPLRFFLVGNPHVSC